MNEETPNRGRGDALADQISKTAQAARDEVHRDVSRRVEVALKSARRKESSLTALALGLVVAALALTLFNVVRSRHQTVELSTDAERRAADSLLAAQASWVEGYRAEHGTLPADLGESALPAEERMWSFTAKGDDDFSLEFRGESGSYEYRSDVNTLSDLKAR